MALITCKNCNQIIDNVTGEVPANPENSILALQEKNEFLEKELSEIKKRLPEEKKETSEKEIEKETDDVY
tara:strand:+ start:148 stop:357 length:210 start_codon:yes stop_codon:yes gene_type:complete